MSTMDVLLVSTSPVAHARDLLSDPAQHPVSEEVVISPAVALRIDRTDHDLTRQVMDACDPGGTVNRQWGCAWGFFREDPPRDPNKPLRWDPDGAMYSAVALSRLVHPNVIGTEYAARVEVEEGRAPGIYPGPVRGRSVHAYLHESIRRRWLTKPEAQELAVLFQRYWQDRSALPKRVTRRVLESRVCSFDRRA